MVSMAEFQDENLYWVQRIYMAWVSFARKHLDHPQDFWVNILWTDEKVQVPLHLA